MERALPQTHTEARTVYWMSTYLIMQYAGELLLERTVAQHQGVYQVARMGLHNKMGDA